MGRFEHSSTMAEYYHDNAAPTAPAAPAAPTAPATITTTATTTTATTTTAAAVKKIAASSMRFLCPDSGTLAGVGDRGAVSSLCASEYRPKQDQPRFYVEESLIIVRFKTTFVIEFL